MINEFGHIGEFHIVTIDKISGKISQEYKRNRIMDVTLNEIVEALMGQAPDVEIKYLAVGTGNTPVTDADTQLANEIFRTPPSAVPSRVSTGRVEHLFTILDTEAVGTIEEIGIFGGSTATAAANSGKLLARVLWHKVKTDSEEIGIKRVDRVVRA